MTLATSVRWLRSLVVMGVLFPATAAAQANAPHPACLDLYQRVDVRDDFLLEPLSLTGCFASRQEPSVSSVQGFETYQRSTLSGELQGYLGYKRIESQAGPVLYILRESPGGNAVTTELLVGVEQDQGTGPVLVNGRTFGLTGACTELTWVEEDADGNIRIGLHLSALDTLRTLVAPRGQPPRQARDNITLKRVFPGLSKAQQSDLEQACLSDAEYMLDPDSLEWRLDALSLNARSQRDDMALETFLTLVPELNDEGVMMVIAENVDRIRHKLISRLTRVQIIPDDQTGQDSQYAAFKDRLRTAVLERDIDALVELTDPEIMLGFGGSGGHDDLRALLTHAQSAREYWSSLEDMLSLASVKMGTSTFCAPYVSCVDIMFEDPFAALVVLDKQTPLFERPIPGARVLTRLNHDVVYQLGVDSRQDGHFIRVQTYDGETGYVRATDVRSPVDMRMEVLREGNDWKIHSLVAGD